MLSQFVEAVTSMLSQFVDTVIKPYHEIITAVATAILAVYTIILARIARRQIVMPELFNAHTFALVLATLEPIQVVNTSGMC